MCLYVCVGISVPVIITAMVIYIIIAMVMYSGVIVITMLKKLVRRYIVVYSSFLCS